MKVTPIYLGAKTPRLGIVSDGADCGTLAVQNGNGDWDLIVDLRKYGHLIQGEDSEAESNETEAESHKNAQPEPAAIEPDHEKPTPRRMTRGKGGEK